MKSLLILCAAALFAAGVSIAADSPPSQTVTVTTVVRQLSAFQGHRADWWAHRTTYWKRRSLSLHRTLMDRPEVSEAINLACRIYGNCSTLWRKARCESGLSPFARNPSGAAGLFQFLPSTWRSTPFGYFSIWSPFANALAAGWMHAHGRGNEWKCQ